MLTPHGPELRTQMAANLAAFERREATSEGRRLAAVAIVVSPYRSKATFLLTRRAMTLRRNAGNYALPGGNFEAGEDAVDAAARELKEELGVRLPRAAVMGLLDDFVTLGGHRVTPVVFWSDKVLRLTPDPLEVHAAWRIALTELDHPEAPRRLPREGGGEPILQMRVNGSWINAPTAAWLWQFREVAVHGRNARLDGIGQPEWTR
ncbi:CoA pyrophosphatase [uncultured Phenylobacterium sp.]|uniref:NUDIX hydrolase n=1 Tax=uncultured Phenylobacterium sp. TaxID=349273 RepID=UPI0025E5339F|nr:CoA pyrophosphatase [uncultured Phenylobacterium sp.]